MAGVSRRGKGNEKCVTLTRRMRRASEYCRDNGAHTILLSRSPGSVRRGRARTTSGWTSRKPYSAILACSTSVIVTVSQKGDRIVAMTWGENTYSLIGNPTHPCMHADPFFPDLEPDQEARIHGELLFFEGSLDAFGEWLENRCAT